MPYSHWLATDYPNIDRILDIISTWDYPRQNPIIADPHSFKRASSAGANKSARKSKIEIARKTETRSEYAWALRKAELIPNEKPLWLKFTKFGDGSDNWVCEVNQGVFSVSKMNDGDYVAYFVSVNEKLAPPFKSGSFNGAMNQLCKWRNFHSHGSLYDLFPAGIHWKATRPPRDNTHTLSHKQGAWFWWEHDYDYVSGWTPSDKFDPSKPLMPVPIGKHARSDKAQEIIDSLSQRKTSNPKANPKGKRATRRKEKFLAGGYSQEEISGIDKFKPVGREVTEYENHELRAMFKPSGKHGMSYVFTYKGKEVFTNDSSSRNARALMNNIDNGNI